MNQENENSEIEVNWYKIWKIIWDRKKIILSIYASVIVLSVIVFFIMPKKYLSDAILMINKSSTTNLSDINPFVVSEMTSLGSSKSAAALFTSGNKLDNDVELLKSQIVLDPVIVKNDLRYDRGPKKGQLLSSKDFSKIIKIEIIKNTNVLTLAYKSSKPDKAYNVVNSIINSYIKNYININSQKATKDREFLELSYKQGKKDFEAKVAEMINNKVQNPDNMVDNLYLNNMYQGLLTKSDRRLKQEVKKIPFSQVENKKMLIDFEIEGEKIKMLKEKYEWSILVEQMAKNAANIVLFKKPNKPQSFEYSEPNIYINILFALVTAFMLSYFTVIFLEKTSNVLTFSDSDNSIVTDQKSLDNFTTKLNSIFNIYNQEKKLVILLHNHNIEKNSPINQIINQLSKSAANTKIIYGYSENNNEIYNLIKTHEVIIFLNELYFTDRFKYNNLTDFCKKFSKNTYLFFVNYT